MDKWFEMIGSIFVIVILSILVVVAFPSFADEKLNRIEFEKPVKKVQKVLQEFRKDVWNVETQEELKQIKKEQAEEITKIKKSINALVQETKRLKTEVQTLKNMDCVQPTTEVESYVSEDFGTGY